MKTRAGAGGVPFCVIGVYLRWHRRRGGRTGSIRGNCEGSVWSGVPAAQVTAYADRDGHVAICYADKDGSFESRGIGGGKVRGDGGGAGI